MGYYESSGSFACGLKHSEFSDLPDYLVCLDLPDEGARVLLVGLDELVHRLDDIVDVPERVPADLLLRELAEPCLDHVDPRRALGGEVELEPGAPLEPPLHVRLGVRPKVVHHHVYVQLLRHALVYRPEEDQELLM